MRMTNTTEIAKEIRENLKKEFPSSKFSVRKQHASAISVSLLSHPTHLTPNQNPYQQINQYHLDTHSNLTEAGKEFFKKAEKIINLRNWDNSDSYTDYFDVNFYLTLSIGDWDKPFITK